MSEQSYGLVQKITGNPGDAQTVTSGPGLMLGGGGEDVDAAMLWLMQRAGGGDVVILRTSGGDGYEPYLFSDLGGCDSVETLVVTTPDIANSDVVRESLAGAEAIFLAGGDQSLHLAAWGGTAVEQELNFAWQRGAILGGTSAGTMVMGAWTFSAEVDSVSSLEALENPYNEFVTLQPSLFTTSFLDGVLFDSHFAARNRLGRLMTFMARMEQDVGVPAPLGIGIDEGTALLIDENGIAEVAGTGSAYFLAPAKGAAVCAPETPLTFEEVDYFELVPGETFAISERQTSAAKKSVSAVAGQIFPFDPY